METNGWVQTDLANALGTNQPVISAWISGTNWPSEKFRNGLAKLYGKTPTDFSYYLEGRKPGEIELPETCAEAMPLLVKLDWNERVRLMQLLLEQSID